MVIIYFIFQKATLCRKKNVMYPIKLYRVIQITHHKISRLNTSCVCTALWRGGHPCGHWSPGFEYYLCHMLAMGPWIVDLTFWVPLASSMKPLLGYWGVWGCQLKKQKCTTWELWVKFYLGQNEDYSPGDSIADSSEKLLQRGKGKVSRCVILVKGEYMQSGTYFLQKDSASYEEQMSPWRILVLF